TAIVVLAGIAIVLATNVAGQLLDEHAYDGALIAVWAFFAGAIYGFASYWFAGFALYLGQRGAGTLAKARPARHVLAYASVPLSSCADRTTPSAGLGLEHRALVLRHRVGVLLLREGSAADVVGIVLERVADLSGEVGVALDETRRGPVVQAQQVVVDEHLPVA